MTTTLQEYRAQGWYNAAEGDPDWCGHMQVDRQAWCCADCERPVTAEMRSILEGFPSVAPDGAVWVLTSFSAAAYHEDVTDSALMEGVYRDYRTIPARSIREMEQSADDMRALLSRLHWYQGAFNHGWMQFWDDTVAWGDHETMVYELHLVDIK